MYEVLSVTDGVPRSWLIGDTVQEGRLLVLVDIGYTAKTRISK